MANYVNVQSPWVGAADSMNRTTDALVASLLQKRRLQEQANQHADQMAIDQGRLDLSQQDMMQRRPLVEAQTGRNNALARFDLARTNQLGNQREDQLNAGLAAFAQAMSGVPGYNSRGTSELVDSQANREALDRAGLRQILTQIAGGSPAAAMGMMKQVNVGQNATSFDPFGGGVMGRGMVNVPPQNYVEQGVAGEGRGMGMLPGQFNSPFGANKFDAMGQITSPGQFRPPGGSQLDPSTIALNFGKLASTINEIGKSKDPQIQAVLARAMQSITGGTNAPIRISTKEEWSRLAPGTSYVGPDGLPATKQ